jgi:hypothetical protein
VHTLFLLASLTKWCLDITKRLLLFGFDVGH